MQDPTPLNQSMNLFVTILGPSGVGKTTIIRKLIAASDEYMYVKPYMTRALRIDETDKVSVSLEAFDLMQQNNEFLVVNEHYGFKYGTPRKTVMEINALGKIPVLDYQLSTIGNLYDPAYSLLNIYIKPHSIDEWEKRLKGAEQYDESRFELGRIELNNIINNQNAYIDAIVINANNQLDQAVLEVMNIIDARKAQN